MGMKHPPGLSNQRSRATLPLPAEPWMSRAAAGGVRAGQCVLPALLGREGRGGGEGGEGGGGSSRKPQLR